MLLTIVKIGKSASTLSAYKVMSTDKHPELEAERNYVTRAYEQLDRARNAARGLTDNVISREGGTHQARFERDVIAERVRERIDHLDIGDQSLIFGRIYLDETKDSTPKNTEPHADTGTDTTAGTSTAESFHIGRVGVSDEQRRQIVVDWRAPIAEKFYRATGPEPMGLSQRRHFISRLRELLAIEDEYFIGASANASSEPGDGQIKGRAALTHALESGRTGRLGDIVATIQGEQDEIIRAPHTGLLLVQGGPGTGKTVVALHRAAYLLFTHRFPLEGQGVLVIGPNRLFMTYIEQVLPSLGESGVELSVLADFVPGCRIRGNDSENLARAKGDIKMLGVITEAVRARQRPIPETLTVSYGVQRLRLTAETANEVVQRTRKRCRNHNHGHRFFVQDFFATLAASARRHDVDPVELQEHLRKDPAVIQAIRYMWPLLTPAELLHDFYQSEAASQNLPLARDHDDSYAHMSLGTVDVRLNSDDDDSEYVFEVDSELSDAANDRIWSHQDVPLLDQAAQLLGAVSGKVADSQLRTYGHIVIDEAQDLSPMQLQMIAQRSLNASMTVVGDIAQATGAWSHQNWDGVLEYLATKKGVTRRELTIGYRLPASLMGYAKKVLAKAMPGLAAPVAVRSGGDPAQIITTTPELFAQSLAQCVQTEQAAIGAGNIAIICQTGVGADISEILNTLDIDHGVAYSGALEKTVSVIEVSMIKGLEIDSAIVIEADNIAAVDGMRSLYVALTRATRRLSVIDTGNTATALD